jgi:hypothetical protein
MAYQFTAERYRLQPTNSPLVERRKQHRAPNHRYPGCVPHEKAPMANARVRRTRDTHCRGRPPPVCDTGANECTGRCMRLPIAPLIGPGSGGFAAVMGPPDRQGGHSQGRVERTTALRLDVASAATKPPAFARSFPAHARGTGGDAHRLAIRTELTGWARSGAVGITQAKPRRLGCCGHKSGLADWRNPEETGIGHTVAMSDRKRAVRCTGHRALLHALEARGLTELSAWLGSWQFEGGWCSLRGGRHRRSRSGVAASGRIAFRRLNYGFRKGPVLGAAGDAGRQPEQRYSQDLAVRSRTTLDTARWVRLYHYYQRAGDERLLCAPSQQ